MNLLAYLISVLSNPLIISAPLAYSLVLKTTGEASYAIQWTLVSMIFAGLVGIFVFYGVKKGFFSDTDVSKREERTKLFLFAAAVSIFYFIVVLITGGPRILLLGVASLLLGIILADVINRRIKASIHLAVFSSFSVIMGILYGGIFWTLLLVAPIVAWSRIKLKKHEPLETIVGGVVGIIIVLLLYFVVKYAIGFYGK
jgi:membrane-associated phospholipid phosphatase